MIYWRVTMTTPLEDLFANLLTPEDVRRWELECSRIDAAIEDLTTKREKFGQMIDLARGLMSSPATEVSKPDTAPDKGDTSPVEPAAAAPRLKRGGRRRREETWKSAIEVIVKASPDGVAYDRIKELVPQRLKEQLEQFPAAKGFYAALAKLESEGVIVRHNSMAFTKNGFARYRKRVAAGEIAEPSRRRGSPMEDTIKQFLRDNDPAKGAEIRAHLIQFDEFAAVIRNSSAMYNVLLRLKAQGEIEHDAEAKTYSLVQENGAPKALPVSAPETGEAATSLFENVVGFPRPR
jgi:hypothetical protein